MSEQENKPLTSPQRPTTSDRDTWRAYWQAQGQLWRTEPEIDSDRKMYFAERLSIASNIEQGIYPFKDVILCRADVEFLLKLHEDNHGPVYFRIGTPSKG